MAMLVVVVVVGLLGVALGAKPNTVDSAKGSGRGQRRRWCGDRDSPAFDSSVEARAMAFSEISYSNSVKMVPYDDDAMPAMNTLMLRGHRLSAAMRMVLGDDQIVGQTSSIRLAHGGAEKLLPLLQHQREHGYLRIPQCFKC
uniref:Dirigent protein n=1 Tax=Oryza rufipogon TaxID=4529 RepID=A0A0E0PYE0_ORYRU